MKLINKNIYSLLLACLTLLLVIFSSCSNEDDLIWDISPLVITLDVRDDAGNDLFDPEFPDNIIESGVCAEYQGKYYDLSPRYIASTRYYMPHFRGLTYENFPYREVAYNIEFGELFGDKNYHDEKIIIHWGDGTKNVIVFTHSFWWKKQKPHSKTTVYLDGEKVSMPIKLVR